MTVTCLQVKNVSNPKLLASIIYGHFVYLKAYPELNHNLVQIEKLLTAQNNVSYLLYFRNQIVAYMIGDTRYVADNRYVYYISYLYVIEKYRSQRIGSLLINQAKKLCRDVGISFIILTCDKNNKKANHFYRKHGFVLDPVMGCQSQHQNVFCLYL